MIWMEGLMVTLVVYTAAAASWSDCRRAIIPNALIGRSIAVALVSMGFIMESGRMNTYLCLLQIWLV